MPQKHNLIKKAMWLFTIRRDERRIALTVAAVYLVLNISLAMAYFDKFSMAREGSWKLFTKLFSVSGFDPITYYALTSWAVKYNVYRHPLLSFFVWPLSKVNDMLLSITGVNLVQFVVMVPLMVCAVYGFLFFRRLLKEVVLLHDKDALLLTTLLFSFAYVSLALIVPDHFGVSFFLLITALYISGRRLRHKGEVSVRFSFLMFLFVSGVTLSNGVKVYLYALFVNGKRFFRWRYLLFAVIVPCLMMWYFARWEYRTFVWPEEMARKHKKAERDKASKERMFLAFCDTVKTRDTALLRRQFHAELQRQALDKYRRDHKQPWNRHKGKPMGKGEFSSWTDISTPRTYTFVENLFGESLFLHGSYLLQDTLRGRPVIVPYNCPLNYVMEAIIVLLVFLGMFIARRQRFMLMALSGFLFDMALHIGLGFGINEVYIMGAHWLFVVPILIAYCFRHCLKYGKRRCLLLLRCAVLMVTLWAIGNNGFLFVRFLME